MKRLFTMLFAAAAVVGCADSGDKVVLSDQNTENQAYEISALAYKVVEAKSYEEFAGARAELEAYEEAMRTQIGGEDYEVFLQSANEVLSNIK